MGNRQVNLLLWAAGLVAGGVLMLLFNFGWLARFEPWVQYIAAGALGLSGVGVLLSTLWARTAWWRLMPGWTLLALGGMVWLSTLDGMARAWIAALLFLGLALAFFHIYLVNRREHWWAIIPGGFMAVFALVIMVSVEVSRVETLGSLLFIGMGLVFGLLMLLAGRRHWWAAIPGTMLILFGLLVYAIANEVQAALLQWWPAALIVAGAVVAFASTLTSPGSEKLQVNVAPRATDETAAPSERGQLGDYHEPAPGATVDLLPDPDGDRR
jgi:hypothetical protein